MGLKLLVGYELARPAKRQRVLHYGAFSFHSREFEVAFAPMFARLILTCLCLAVCASTLTLAAATKLDADKIPQLYCGSNKSASGTSLDGDEITYFATINNITGPFSVHLYMKRVDCSPSCDPSVLSIFAADGKVSPCTCCALRSLDATHLHAIHSLTQY